MAQVLQAGKLSRLLVATLAKRDLASSSRSAGELVRQFPHPPVKLRRVFSRAIQTLKTKMISNLLLRVAVVVGVLVLTGLQAGATTFYVKPNGHDNRSGTNWTDAKQTIQAAVDAATDYDTVIVTNGLYSSGGVAEADGLTNRVGIYRAITVQSVNGPLFTSIVGARHPGTTNGASAVRCVYMTDYAVLSGFTLTNGATLNIGITNFSGVNVGLYAGGVYGTELSVVDNCILKGNAGALAGASYGGRLNRCIITNNIATGYGVGAALQGGPGGAYLGTLANCLIVKNQGHQGACQSDTLYNCTVTGNASSNSAVLLSTLNNCIVYYNTSASGANIGSLRQINTNCSAVYTCATQLPSGEGNITNAPNFAATNIFRLGPLSPCADSGMNLAESGFADLDGQPRLFRTMDMGCYERQIPGDANNDGLVDASDLNMVLTNYSSAVDQTAVSTVLSNYWPNQLLLAMTNVAGVGGTDVTFALTNSNAGAYNVQYSTNLVNWDLLGAATPRYLFTDTNAPAVPQRYYRLSLP
ncbi:MAG: hypothetical protein JWQ71_1468 [Pedosphaera sp.]|nr:hypothetical protein [Pedosphaera sp.]